jgi:hypothetical protein
MKANPKTETAATPTNARHNNREPPGLPAFARARAGLALPFGFAWAIGGSGFGRVRRTMVERGGMAAILTANRRDGQTAPTNPTGPLGLHRGSETVFPAPPCTEYDRIAGAKKLRRRWKS